MYIWKYYMYYKFWKYNIIYNIIYSNHAIYHLIMYFICGIKSYDHMFIIIWKSCLCLDIKAIISLISCLNIYEAMVMINLYVYSNKLHRLSQIIYQKMKIPPLCFPEIRWLQRSMANVLSCTLMVTYGAGFGALFMKFLLNCDDILGKNNLE